MKSGIRVKGYLVRLISDGNGMAVLWCEQDRPWGMTVTEDIDELPGELRQDKMIREPKGEDIMDEMRADMTVKFVDYFSFTGYPTVVR